MNPKDLKNFLTKELRVKNLHEGNGGWLRGLCPIHNENRVSWGIYSGAEHHPTKCFSCGVSNLLTTTSTVLGVGIKEAIRLLSKYGYLNGGIDRDELKKLKFLPFEERLERKESLEIPIFMIAPYAGKYLNIVKVRYGYDDDYLKSLNLGVDKLSKRIVIPWFFKNRLVGVTGRHVLKSPDGEPKTIPYFGFKKGNALYIPSGKLDDSKPLIVVEGEGDAMSVNRVYSNVAAVGSASFSGIQKDIILASGVNTVIVFKDPDEAGELFSASIEKTLKGKLRVLSVGHGFKDPGDCLKYEIQDLIERVM